MSILIFHLEPPLSDSIPNNLYITLYYPFDFSLAGGVRVKWIFKRLRLTRAAKMINWTSPLPGACPNDSMPQCAAGNGTHLAGNESILTSGCSQFYDKEPSKPGVGDFVIVIIYGLLCIVGLVGNGMVVFVICRYTKMKTVTNMYILNLSIADFLFLLGLPMIMTTVVVKYWLFGFVMCKIYYILTCINMFTGAFTLTVMSGDRFLAVCYPIDSMRYRTSYYATIALAIIWVVSFLVMLPVFLYVQILEHPCRPGIYSCTIQWPTMGHGISPEKAYVCYTMVLGFIVPVIVICVLYTLLLIRLRASGPMAKSAEKKRSHRKVTQLVTMIIAVYIICWLPYWAFQFHLILPGVFIFPWKVYMFQVFTILSYANSMINPMLYAFTNENFRESFISAFRCAADPIRGGRRSSEFNSMANNNSVGGRTKKIKTEPHTEYEFTTLNGSSELGNNKCGEEV